MFGRKSFQQEFSEATAVINAGMTNSLIRLKQEDIGWASIGGDSDWSDSVPLEIIKEHAARARRLAAYNPLVKRGITIRNAYMWTDPFTFEVADNVREKIQDNVLSVAARVRDEASFATDGCVIYLVERASKTVIPIDITRLLGVARADDALSKGDIFALLIAPVNRDEKATWYVLDEKPWQRVDDPQQETSKNIRAVYQTVNRQSGEKFGKPDLMGAVYYAQAYKEYLETAHLTAKALARIAYKAKSVNARQQQAVMTKMVGSGVGATASIGAGQDIQAVSKAGAGVDFSAGAPLAAMVSAALDVPLSVLLTDGSAGGRQGAETALEDPTFKALELRRTVHVELVHKIAKALGTTIEIKYGGINNDVTHRRVQSLILAYQQGALHQVEMRAGVMQILQIAGALPVEDLPELPQADTSALGVDGTSSDGRSTGVGALSDGTNDNRTNATNA